MTKLKIGVVGASITGLSTALKFSKLFGEGIDVRVFEARSSGMQDQGAGIGVPRDMLTRAAQAGLLSSEMPQLQMTHRSLFTTEASSGQQKPLIRNQSFDMVALNWKHLYQELSDRLPSEILHRGEQVLAVSQDMQHAKIRTSQGEYEFDFIIGADGINSTVRKHLFPNLQLKQAGYIAWRGICDVSVAETAEHGSNGGLYLFNDGHLVVYNIPADDYAATGKTVTNWVLYEYNPDVNSSEHLVDKHGKQHHFSVPKGLLSQAKIQHIHKLAKRVLPPEIAEIVLKTETPFAQDIVELIVPEHVGHRMILLGDAAACLRPHVGAGAVKAIESSDSLAKALYVPREQQLDRLQRWNEEQKTKTDALYDLSRRLGADLVTNAPDWPTMDEASAEAYWKAIMTGRNWYTSANRSFWNKPHAVSSSSTTPSP